MKQIIYKSIGVGLNLACKIYPKYGEELGYKLMCKPIRTKLKEHQLLFLNSSVKVDFVLKGNRIQGYKWGSGKTKILLVHGWSSNSFRWKKLVEKLLDEDCTIFAFDAPAHGLSEGRILNVAIYEKTLKKIEKTFGPFESVIGHSIGGFASMFSMYNNNHQNLKNAVIMASPAEANDFFVFYKEMLSLSNHALNKIKTKFENELGNEISYYNSKQFAKKITTPVLLIHDILDKDTSSKNTEELSTLLKNNELIITEGLGHNLKSEDLNKKIVKYVL